MREIVQHLRESQIKGWLRNRPRWQPYAQATEADLKHAKAVAGASLPADLNEFLECLGFGDIADDELSFRREWFSAVEFGSLKGAAVLFAQDVLGNFYAFVPPTSRIVYFSRGESGYAELAPSFTSFMEELQRRQYELLKWVDSLDLVPYDWNAV